MPDIEIENLRFAAVFHDIGKVGIDHHILNKPGALNEGEWAMIRMHPGFGCRILKPLDLHESIRKAVLGHHENYDGSGYPDGLKGDDIPLMARILRIVDTFDALSSHRPDRKAIPADQALGVLWKYQHNFDPLLLDEFEKMLTDDPHA